MGYFSNSVGAYLFRVPGEVLFFVRKLFQMASSSLKFFFAGSLATGRKRHCLIHKAIFNICVNVKHTYIIRIFRKTLVDYDLWEVLNPPVFPTWQKERHFRIGTRWKILKLLYYAPTIFFSFKRPACGQLGSRSCFGHTYQQQSWQVQTINFLKPCYQWLYIINTFGGGGINNSNDRNRPLWNNSILDCTEECLAFTIK